MAGIDSAAGQVIAFANKMASTTDARLAFIADPDVPVESRLSFFVPLLFCLEGFTLSLATLTAFFLCFVLRLDALSLCFHLVFCAKLQRVDCAMLRAAPPHVGEGSGEFLFAYLAGATGWLTHFPPLQSANSGLCGRR